jgi:dienelactone hydrolase
MKPVLLGLLIAIYVAAPAARGAGQQEVDVTATDGIKLRATYYDPGKLGPGVILFQQCTRERKIWEPMATALSGLGVHVLVVTPRGTQDSQGAQWDYDGSLEHALDYWRKNWSGDAESAYQWLIARPAVNQDNIVTMGAGCGAFLALLNAERHYPAVRSAVFFSDFVDDSTRRFLENSTRLAIFSAVSEQDPMSLSSAKEIHSLSKNAANRFLTYPEQAHGFRLIENHPELETTVFDWIKAQLLGAPSDPRVNEILRIHAADRAAHLRGDASDMAARIAPEVIAVNEGKITRETRAQHVKHLEDYFHRVQHSAWEDVEPPIVHVSPDGTTAWAIFHVHSAYTETKPDDTKEAGGFKGTWMSTYEKIDGRWQMTAVITSREEEK